MFLVFITLNIHEHNMRNFMKVFGLPTYRPQSTKLGVMEKLNVVFINVLLLLINLDMLL